MTQIYNRRSSQTRRVRPASLILKSPTHESNASTGHKLTVCDVRAAGTNATGSVRKRFELHKSMVQLLETDSRSEHGKSPPAKRVTTKATDRLVAIPTSVVQVAATCGWLAGCPAWLRV